MYNDVVPGVVAARTRYGLPAGLAWGTVAVAVFVVGDALELVWIAAFFSTDLGIPLRRAAWIITAFGAVATISSYLVGSLCRVMHPRRVMLFGLCLWCLIDTSFIALALQSRSFWLILVTYALRGVGTPLYCFSFLVWLTERASPGQEATTQGWFWLALSGGNQIVGIALASVALGRAGPIATLWIGLAITAVGGMIGVVLTRDPPGTGERPRASGIGKSFGESASILIRKPRIAAGGLVKMINIGGVMGMYVLYVPYLTGVIGLAPKRSVLVFAIMGITGVPGNLLWGYVSDRIGWANTVQWFACPINMVAIALLYFVPRWCGPTMLPVACVMLFWGAGTSAFAPLSALLAGIAPREVGNALSVVNVATGLAMMAGPALVGALLGLGGYVTVMMAFVLLYVFAFFVMFYVQLPGRARTFASLRQPEAIS